MLSLEQKKAQAVRLLEIAFDSDLSIDRKREQMSRIINPRKYIQHSAGIADGLESLLALIAGFDRDTPGYAVHVKRVIAEGDLVFVHCHYTFGPADKLGKAIAEVFRYEGDFMVEHWDVIQDVPARSANSNGMF